MTPFVCNVQLQHTLTRYILAAAKKLLITQLCEAMDLGCGWHLQDERFRIEKRTYDNQYAQLYYCRLLKMAPRLKQRIEKQWPGVAGRHRSPDPQKWVPFLKHGSKKSSLTLDSVDSSCALQSQRSWTYLRIRRLLLLGRSTKR